MCIHSCQQNECQPILQGQFKFCNYTQRGTHLHHQLSSCLGWEIELFSDIQFAFLNTKYCCRTLLYIMDTCLKDTENLLFYVIWPEQDGVTFFCFSISCNKDDNWILSQTIFHFCFLFTFPSKEYGMHSWKRHSTKSVFPWRMPGLIFKHHTTAKLHNKALLIHDKSSPVVNLHGM